MAVVLERLFSDEVVVNALIQWLSASSDELVRSVTVMHRYSV